MEVSRKEARENSLKYYFILDECENGHVAERLTISGACTECIRERNEIFIEDKKDYIVKKKNKRLAKVKAKLAKDEELRMYLEDPSYRVYCDEDQFEGIDFLPKSREEARALGSLHYLPNKPCKAGHTTPRKTRTGTCPVCEKADGRRDRLINPEKYRARRQRRRARQFEVGGSFTGKDVKALYEEQSGICKFCSVDLKITGYHIDHIMPLILMGRNSKENLQLLCPQCNLSKGGMHPDAWEDKINRMRDEEYDGTIEEIL